MTTAARVRLAGMAATMMVALALGPVVQGRGWLMAAFVLVVLPPAVGSGVSRLTRQTTVPVTAAIVSLVLALTWLFVREAAVLGVFPGPEALEALNALLVDGVEVSRAEAPPVPAGRGVLLIVAGGVGLVGLSVDLIAVTLRRPAVAGLPLLALYCVPAAVLPGGLPWPYFVLGALGFLALVGADSGERARGWGRALAAAEQPRARISFSRFLGAGPPVVVVCVIVATVLPAAVPGLQGQLVRRSEASSGAGSGDNITVINPLLALREDLRSRDNTVVVRYRTSAPAPEPLRIVTDDAFDGASWSPSVGAIPRNNRVQRGLPSAPGLSARVAVTGHRTSIDVLELRQTYLPLPYPTTRVEIDGAWLYDPQTLNVVGDHVTTHNVSYSVDHLAVAPTAAQLRAASTAPADLAATYTRLPAGLPPQIAATARAQAGRGTDYDQALALQKFFRTTGGFVYSETVLPPRGSTDSGQDAVLTFLQDRRGYCVQFASAMAVMARSLGIPARVAVGFLPGSPTPDGGYQITVRDAHAWPELYFEGVGWVRFEPTPAARSGPPPSWSGAGEPVAPSRTPGASTAPSTSAGQALPSAGPANPQGAGQDKTETAPARSVPWGLVGGFTLMAVLLAMPRLGATMGRRRRWRLAKGDSAVAEAAWTELGERLGDLGIRRGRAWTARGMARRLVAEHDLDESARSALMALVTEVERARYAPAPGALPPGALPPGALPPGALPGKEGRSVAAIRADLDGVLDAVTRSVTISPGRRRRARWFPASGIRGWLSLWPQFRTAGTNAPSRGQLTDVTSPTSTADGGERVGAGSARPLDQYGAAGTK